jgi:hypothetical protein
MKKVAALLLMVSSSCSSPKFLPASTEIHSNPYGSYISVALRNGTFFRGELIAIDTVNMLILSETIGKCISIKVSDAKNFTLKYAKSKHYGWSIPVFTLFTLSHGGYALATAPLNLIVTIVVTSSGEHAFTYNNKNMTLDQIRMFARFPQGIPKNLPIESIHS